MSQESLRSLLARAKEDQQFSEQLTDELLGVLANYGLSREEGIAVLANDEESLRKLSGADTEPYLAQVACPFATAYCAVSVGIVATRATR